MSNSVERELDNPCCDSQCTVWSARQQRMYKGYDIHDTILIKPRRGGFGVETDIEIPFAVDPLKGTAGARDVMMKNKVILTMALGPKIPVGVRGPWFHQHHSPNLLPSVAALHTHDAQVGPVLEVVQSAARGLAVVAGNTLEARRSGIPHRAGEAG